MGKFVFEKKNKDIGKSLLKWNWLMCLLHLVQGIIMFILGSKLEFSITIYGMWFDYTQISLGIPPFLHPTELFELNNIGIFVSIFLFLSSFAHFYAGVIRKDQYLMNLESKTNPYRWWEYSFSASLMIVLIGIFFNIVDISTLILLFSCIFIMNACGLIMEKMNLEKEKIDWLPYNIGVFAMLIAWAIIVLHFWGATEYGGEPPNFVYAIFFVEFALFSSFAFVMIAYYKKWGKFSDYLFCEKSYQILSLVAKSLLAWLVFFGIFSPN